MKALYCLLLLIQPIFSEEPRGTFYRNLPSLQALLNGKTNQQKITELFGKPTKTLVTKENEGSLSEIIWEFRASHTPRLTISFEKNTETVLGWTWEIPDNDPERDLKTTLNYFPGASWTVEPDKWVNPHNLVVDCRFKDSTQGLTVTYNPRKKIVTSISGWNPARILSSTGPENPPTFCIEGYCGPALLTKNVFEKSPCPVQPH